MNHNKYQKSETCRFVSNGKYHLSEHEVKELLDDFAIDVQGWILCSSLFD
jgi:hypothetical protein